MYANNAPNDIKAINDLRPLHISATTIEQSLKNILLPSCTAGTPARLIILIAHPAAKSFIFKLKAAIAESGMGTMAVRKRIGNSNFLPTSLPNRKKMIPSKTSINEKPEVKRMRIKALAICINTPTLNNTIPNLEELNVIS
jgi:hypothetical protein